MMGGKKFTHKTLLTYFKRVGITTCTHMEYNDDNDVPENLLVQPGSSVGDDSNIEYISKEGYDKFRAELEILKTKERLNIAERLEYAKSLGDLSENAEFDAAKEEQMLNEMRIGELESLLRRATIITKKTSPSSVTIGSHITAHVVTSNKIETYIIVGSSEEADPLSGRVSHESPFGHAFLGHKKGEEVTVVTLRGDVKYVIVEIA
jgi:transcription elongation factor GreA